MWSRRGLKYGKARKNAVFEGIIWFQFQEKQAAEGCTLSRPDAIAEVVILEEPEDLDADRYSQPSVIDKAKKFKSVLSKYSSVRDALHSKGLVFGGRVLLFGAAGTDFEAFSHHIAYETPMKIVRLRMTQALGDSQQISDSIRTMIEYAKRNSPALVYIHLLKCIKRNYLGSERNINCRSYCSP